MYDVSTPEEPELIREVDAHWHDVTALRLWMRTTPVEEGQGKLQVEPWIISASLDGTIRKWRLGGAYRFIQISIGPLTSVVDLLTPPTAAPKARPSEPKPVEAPGPPSAAYQMSEEEERELAELMDEDQ